MTAQQDGCPRTTEVVPFVMGELDLDQRESLDLHLGECGWCQAELRSLSPALEGLVEAIPAVPTPPGALAKLKARMHRAPAEQPAPTAQAPEGIHFAFGKDARFLPTPYPGIEVRPLHVDRDAGRISFLARMAPGASFPQHEHIEAEECYVLEGSVTIGAIEMSAGDYQAAEGGSTHPVHVSEGGCLLLFHAGVADHQQLAAAAG